MLGWFSADPSCILNGQNVYMSCLDGFRPDPYYILNSLHVMLRWFGAHPSYILNGQDVYMACLDGLVQTHLIS
jgi:hypothetical protein